MRSGNAELSRQQVYETLAKLKASGRKTCSSCKTVKIFASFPTTRKTCKTCLEKRKSRYKHRHVDLYRYVKSSAEPCLCAIPGPFLVQSVHSGGRDFVTQNTKRASTRIDAIMFFLESPRRSTAASRRRQRQRPGGAPASMSTLTSRRSATRGRVVTFKRRQPRRWRNRTISLPSSSAPVRRGRSPLRTSPRSDGL